MIKVAIAGLGARGHHTYAQYQHKHPQEMKIVAISDTDVKKLDSVKMEFCIPDEFCFNSAEEMLSAPKLADAVFITTQDGDHLRHTLMALEKGYDVLLEKPIATSAQDCIMLRDAVLHSGRLVIVCHVLRYAEFYRNIKKVIDSGIIGDIATIHAIENVGYWHQAHSFVRGNWRNSSVSSPMILQKCCHDFDILTFLTDKKCLRISSFGSLKHFIPKNKPAGAADRCLECRYSADCVYSAVQIYLDSDVTGIRKGNSAWPCDILAENPTEEKVLDALRSGSYGRCVYACDNNVVDHQVAAIEFEDGITATFTMTGFTEKCYRHIRIMGTKGEIEGDQDANIVTVRPFGKEPVVYDISKMTDDLSGHGGGDNRLLALFFGALNGVEDMNASSTIINSMQSHIMAFAAEHSRLNNGCSIALDEFEELFIR